MSASGRDLADMDRIVNEFDLTVNANTGILPSPAGPGDGPPNLIRIYVTPDAQGVLRVHRTRGATTHQEELNGGSPLTAGAAFIFDIAVDDGDEIQLQYDTAATFRSLLVARVAGGGT